MRLTLIVGGVHVHVVLPFFHPTIGGVQTRVRELGRRLVTRGHRVTVHCLAVTDRGEPLPPIDHADGIEIERSRPLLRRGGYLLFFLPRLPSGALVDVHAYPFLPGDWLRVARRRDLRLVHTPQGAPFRPPSRTARTLVRAYDAMLGLPTLRRASRVVVITENERRWLAARGVDPARIVEVPNGVADEAFAPRDATIALERWGVARYVLFLGRLFHEKGPLDLVRALPTLPPDVAAVFAGPDQGEAGQIRAFANRLGVGERIVVAGAVPEETKWGLLAGCEALCLPSAWEAQGIVLLEAWAQGKAVVATRVGGTPLVVEHGRTGLLVPWNRPDLLGGALAEVLADPEQARAMGDAGREVVRSRYLWDDLVVRVERVYEEALAV